MNRYSYGYDKETMAKALGRSLSISTKQGIEICSHIKGMKLSKAEQFLKDVISQKTALPFKRFNKDMGHKKGMSAGRYPVNACKQVLKIVENAENNATIKNLSREKLIIVHANAHKSSNTWHYGRQRRRRMKRTHLEVIVKEAEKK